MCILFLWSHISPSMEGGFSKKWDLHCLYVYINSLGHLFSQICRGLLRELRIAMSVCVYYSLGHVFPQHLDGVAHRNLELQCMYMYIIPLVTYFPKHGGGLFRAIRIALSVRVYYSFDRIFPQICKGVAHINENCKVCMCILFPWSPISPNLEGVAHINENCNVMYMYIIPFITYFTNTEGVVHRNKNCNVCICILFPWSPIYPTRRVLLREIRIPMSVCVYYSLVHVFPQTWRGLLKEMGIARYVCV